MLPTAGHTRQASTIRLHKIIAAEHPNKYARAVNRIAVARTTGRVSANFGKNMPAGLEELLDRLGYKVEASARGVPTDDTTYTIRW